MTYRCSGKSKGASRKEGREGRERDKETKTEASKPLHRVLKMP